MSFIHKSRKDPCKLRKKHHVTIEKVKKRGEMKTKEGRTSDLLDVTSLSRVGFCSVSKCTHPDRSPMTTDGLELLGDASPERHVIESVATVVVAA